MSDLSSNELVDGLMAAIQSFASAWSLVGSCFDNGRMLHDVENEKTALRVRLESLLAIPEPPQASNEQFAWLLEICGGRPLYFGPNRESGYLTDCTYDHNKAVKFQRKKDAESAAEWLRLTNVNRDPDPPRDFIAVEHGWMDRASNEPRAELQAAAFDLIDVLDAALIGAPDTGLRVRAENYLPVMAAITRVKDALSERAAQPPELVRDFDEDGETVTECLTCCSRFSDQAAADLKDRLGITKQPEPPAPECSHPHDQIIRGHDALTDMAWCDACGEITWASDHPPLENPEGIDRKDWVRNRLIAWGCGAETKGQQRCSVWCGNRKYCVASLRATATKRLRPPFGECTAVINDGADLCTEQAEPGTHRCKRHSLGESAATKGEG